MSTITDAHETLFRLYEHYVGDADSKKDVYGYWLFVLGFVVGGLAVLLYVVNFEATQPQSSAEFFVNRIVGILGSIGFTIGLFGLVLMLPVRRRAIQASVAGLFFALLGAASFGIAYPDHWRGIGDSPDYTIPVLGLYTVGLGIIAGVTALVPVVTGQKAKYLAEEGATDDPPVLTGDAMEGAQFAVFRDEDGDWAWHVLHMEALAASEDSAPTQPDAEAGIERVQSQIGSAGLLELTTAAFRLYESGEGEWQWTLVRDDGSVVARCDGQFDDRDGAESSVSFLKDRGPAADVIEIDDAAFSYTQRRDRWHWELLDADRSTIATSPEGFATRDDAEAAADVFVDRFDDARLLAIEHVAVELLDEDDGWTWRLVDDQDEELARSTVTYDGRRDVEESVEALLPGLESAAVTVAGEPAFERYGTGDNWRWRLVDGNERIVARNPGDPGSREAIDRGAERFAAAASDADVIEIEDAAYETYPVPADSVDDDAVGVAPTDDQSDDEDPGPYWRWRLVTDDREVIAASTEPHASGADAADAVERMRDQAAAAELIEFESSAFQVYEADTGEWRWRLIDEDGNVLADSGAEHDSKGEAAEAMMTLKEQAPDAELLEIETAAFELFVDDGEWGWRLIDEGGKLVAEDPASHPTRGAARQAMNRLVDHLDSEIRRMERAAFQTYVDDTDWRWRFVLPTGDVVAAGESAHPTRDELVESIGTVRGAAADAATHTIGDVTVQVHGNGAWRWRLLDRDREVVAESSAAYDDRESVLDAVDALQSTAADASIFTVEDAIVRLTEAGDGWTWNLVDADREVLATAGTAIAGRGAAIDAVDAVRRLAPLAGSVDFDVAQFEPVSGDDGWSWRLIDEDGTTVAEGAQRYDTEGGVQRAIDDVRDLITEASILEIDGVSFELHAADEGWSWRLVDEHGNALSHGTRSYETRTDAREAMNAVKAHAPEGWTTFTD